MFKGTCPRCDSEFITDAEKTDCNHCGFEIKPRFCFIKGHPILINSKLEIEAFPVGENEENYYGILRDNLLKFARENRPKGKYVQDVFEKTLVDLNKEFAHAQTEGDESYIRRIMKSKDVVEEVLDTIKK